MNGQPGGPMPPYQPPNRPMGGPPMQTGGPMPSYYPPPPPPPPPPVETGVYTPGGAVAPVYLFNLASFPGPRVFIGRDPQCELRLNHPAVSRRQTVLERYGPQWIIRNLSNRNPTLITRRGQSFLVRHPLPLEVGDRIAFPPYVLVYNGKELEPNYEIEMLADHLNQTVRVSGWRGLTGQSKKLLDEVSLAIKPREFVAIISGSGAGKSTLLKALSGYTQNGGRVYLNRYDYYANFNTFRSQVGFVPQSDIIHGELTVRAALTYAARLRLGKNYEKDEIDKRVMEVIERLDLGAHQATLVNKLSGGQRKRVSIAVELLTKPTLFFLDEPTSGLDPGLEAEMMQLLRGLADDGHTIILVTHSVTNISRCNKLAVLGAGGVLVFYGLPGRLGEATPQTALAHFGVREHADIYRVVQPTIRREGNTFRLKLPPECKNQALQAQATELNKRPWNKASDLLAAWTQGLRAYFQQSQTYRENIAGPLGQLAGQSAPPQPDATARALPAKSGLKAYQVRVLAQRYLSLLSRDWFALALLLIQAPLIGWVVSLLITSPDLFNPDPKHLLDTQQVLAMMACSVLWFGIINSAREVVKEGPIYRRERFINLNIVAYLASKVVVLASICAIQCLLLLIPILLKGVDMSGPGAFLPLPIEVYISLLLTALAGLAVGLLVSCALPSSERVTYAVPIVLLPQIILNPTLLTHPEGFLNLIVNVFIVSKWGLVALGDSAGLGRMNLLTDIYNNDGPGGILQAWLILIVMGLVCLTLAGLLLRYRDEQPKTKGI